MRYYKIFICGFMGLLLMATGTFAIAAQQGKTVHGNQYAFQKKRPTTHDSLVRPSAKKQYYRQNTARDALKSGRIVSLSVIRRKIQKKYPGKIVDVRLIEPISRTRPYIYKVKVLRKDGKLLVLKINASNARIVGVKGNK